ncbi:MAG: hypothetical protein VR64_23225 [Desulfatitalea sp. BRH_c12]|nr:MAG: hypothetical protein VR64_23225 [Desulfatitalea sp. BRH_c12]
MERMTLVIDVAKCTGCRSCQVACKNWNQLKGEQTENRGSHENPPDLSANTWNRVVFVESRDANGKIDMTFISDRCRHCEDPPCLEIGQSVPGAVVQDDSGAVIFGKKTREMDFDDLTSNCPYDIPRKNEATGRISKCTMCNDRVSNGLQPACVKACPSGALQFGPRQEMLRFASGRIEALGGDANLYPGEEHNVLWVLPESSRKYPLAQAPTGWKNYRVA